MLPFFFFLKKRHLQNDVVLGFQQPKRRPLSYCFGLHLGPCCVMFMACFVVLIGIWPILRSQLRRDCSQSKGLLPKRIWVENLRVREFPKCSRNPRAHYYVEDKDLVEFALYSFLEFF